MEILLFAIAVKFPEHVSMICLHVLKYSRKFPTNHINLASFHFTYGSKKKVDFSLPLSKLCTLRQLKNKSVISPYLTVAVLSDVLNIELHAMKRKSQKLQNQLIWNQNALTSIMLIELCPNENDKSNIAKPSELNCCSKQTTV